MNKKRKTRLWIFVIVLLAGAAVAAAYLIRALQPQPIVLRGATISRNSDPNKELPIAGVQITTEDGLPARTAESDASGFFRLVLPRGIRPHHPVTVQFRSPDYLPLDLTVTLGKRLYVIRMIPKPRRAAAPAGGPRTIVSNLAVRYSVKDTTTVSVGSVVKTFQVANTGNVPCNGGSPCSPDGNWKAAMGSVSLDAAAGNIFENLRASCIAGPCPFTRIEQRKLRDGGRKIFVSARNWSDTATFLVEAEVAHPMVSSSVRVSYPVVFGQTLNFTVPASAEGVSIEAEMNGSPIVFPLGPDLFLRWAACVSRGAANHAQVYRCELKPGYQFKK